MSSPINFNGLVSGLDTKSIIQAMLQTYQLPVKLMQAQQANENTKLQAYQDLNTKLQALQTATSTLSLQSSVGAKKADVSGPSGSFASATATADALNGSFQLQIDNLATPTTLLSTTAIGGAITGADIAVNNPKMALPITTGSFSVNGHVVNVSGTSTFGSVVADVQAALQTTFGASATATVGADNKIHLSTGTGSGTIQLGSGGDTSNFLAVTHLAAQPGGPTVDSGAPLGVTNPAVKLDSANLNGLTSTAGGSFSVNGVTITYDTTVDTLNTVLGRINASTAGVTASYDPTTDRVALTSTKTGSTDVSVADAGGNLVASLNLNTAGAHHLGQSAKYEVNGTTQYSLSNTVSDIVSGVNVTFQAGTPSALTVAVSQDPSVGSGAIQSFITAYNNVLDTINKDQAYDPTTQTAGIFLGDPVVSGLASQLNDGLFIEHGSSLGLTPGFTTASAIGISTGPIGSTPGTTTDLTFNASAFQNALATNPAAVTNLTTTLFGKLNTTLMKLTQPGGQIDNAIQAENSQIRDFTSQINTQNDFIAQQQAFLSQQFSALEGQLAQIQSQASVGAAALGQFNASAASSQPSATQQLLSSGASGS